MKKGEGWQMYIKIQELKKMGLKKSQIARKLGISRPTLDKYINMTPDEFEKAIIQECSKKPDMYYEDILGWLKEFSDLSTA